MNTGRTTQAAQRCLGELAGAGGPDAEPGPPSCSSAAATVTPGVRPILDALDRLPPDECVAFDLVRVQGLTQPEVAAEIGCPTRTVKRRLDRGLALLDRGLPDPIARPNEMA